MFMGNDMKVKELIEILQRMPAELEVMLPAEGNIDHVQAVYIAQVAKTRRDWSGTPVGNFKMLGDDDEGEETTEPFQAVVIDLDPQIP